MTASQANSMMLLVALAGDRMKPIAGLARFYTLGTRAFQFAIRIDSFGKNRPFDSLVVMQFLH